MYPSTECLSITCRSVLLTVCSASKLNMLYISIYLSIHLYPMSVQSVKKGNECTLATAHKKFQHTLARAEKSVKYRVWQGRNKTYFYHIIHRETQNSPAKVFTKSAGLPANRRRLRFFTPRPNTARKFSNCRSNKGYIYQPIYLSIYILFITI